MTICDLVIGKLRKKGADPISEPVIIPGLVVPGLRCPLCGFGAVEWLDKGTWVLKQHKIPQPHYLCYNCHAVFHIKPVSKSEPWKLNKLP